MSSIDEIKTKLDIVDVIGSYVTLTKAGSNHKARCPFHNERTPSFSVSSDRQMFYCFGCGVGGDMIDFVEKIEGVDFHGAMRILADRAGVQLTYGAQEDRGEKEQLYELMETATLYYQGQLSQYTEAVSYVKGRGVTDASFKVWRLGFAPGPVATGQWRTLYDHLTAKGWSDDDLLKAGLIKRSENGRLYDTFRDRITFPINDTAGRPVAFSGRIFSSESSTGSTSSGQAAPPKYLNSPDTPIFHKSTVLHGFDHAKQAIRKMNFAVLVEGQMDLVLSHQCGFRNTVATSGTSVTGDHLRRLHRLAPNLMLAFDADSAGVSAVQKTAAMALSLGMDVKVAVTPEGKDPADILKESADDWKQILVTAEHVIMFLLNYYSRQADGDQRKRTRSVTEHILPYVASLPKRSEQSYFITQISQRTGIREDALWSDTNSVQPAADRATEEHLHTPSPIDQDNEGDHDQRDRLTFVSRHIAGLIVWQRNKEVSDVDTEDLLKQFRDIIGTDKADQMLTDAEADTDLLFQIEEHYQDESPQKKGTDELFRELLIEVLIRQRDHVKDSLNSTAEERGMEKEKALMEQLQTLQLKIDQLKTEGYNH